MKLFFESRFFYFESNCNKFACKTQFDGLVLVAPGGPQMGPMNLAIRDGKSSLPELTTTHISLLCLANGNGIRLIDMRGFSTCNQ